MTVDKLNNLCKFNKRPEWRMRNEMLTAEVEFEKCCHQSVFVIYSVRILKLLRFLHEASIHELLVIPCYTTRGNIGMLTANSITLSHQPLLTKWLKGTSLNIDEILSQANN
ncbi:hypothetical protein LOAG_11324 [Loa loa]|uniref:Uncharacterized protein n=1 Tax=Loa loa TaxID=7209 RepID=A0A1S0TNA6_LOALO|nr:hypothetical protein LOAG_11324 [Loa loa]EFO17177.1 hypothetical protein LOAG_11324 [Loa loa]